MSFTALWACRKPIRKTGCGCCIAAANVVSPIDQKLTQTFAKEGTAIETKLVAEGQKPAVSMLAGGHVDCASAATFVQTLPAASVMDAEQSLLGAITTCPKQVDQAAKTKLDAAVNQSVVAGRPIMALMEAEGAKSQWSRAMFAKMFASLPTDAASNTDEAPNYAAMFARLPRRWTKTRSRRPERNSCSGWRSCLTSPQRSVAVNLASGVLSDTLGATAYQELLRSDPMIQQAVGGADQKAMLPTPEEDGVSVLHAMGGTGDRTDRNSMTCLRRSVLVKRRRVVSPVGPQAIDAWPTITSTSRLPRWTRSGQLAPNRRPMRQKLSRKSAKRRRRLIPSQR